MKTRLLSVISAIFALFIFSGCANEDAPAKYVFLFIGDGMGTSHVDVTESYLSYKAGVLGGEQLLMTTFPVLLFFQFLRLTLVTSHLIRWLIPHESESLLY